LEITNYQRFRDNIDSKNLLLILFFETREIQKSVNKLGLRLISSGGAK